MYPAESARPAPTPTGPDRPLPPLGDGSPEDQERRASCAPKQEQSKSLVPYRHCHVLRSFFQVRCLPLLSAFRFCFAPASARRTRAALGSLRMVAAAADQARLRRVGAGPRRLRGVQGIQGRTFRGARPLRRTFRAGARKAPCVGVFLLPTFLLHKHCAAGAARTAKLAAERRRAGCPESRKVGRSTEGRAKALALRKKKQRRWIPAFAGMTS